MSLPESIYSRLTGHAGLSALVSTRCYLNKLPQKPTFPAIRFQEISNVPVHSMRTTSGTGRARYQFSVWAKSYSAAHAAHVELLAALSRWRDLSVAPKITDSVVDSTTTMYEDELEVHHITTDIHFLITE